MIYSFPIPKVIDEMFTHSSEEIYYLANSYERDSFGSIPVLKYPPFFEEWMVSKCKSHLNDEEFELLNNLSMKSALNSLTTIEKYALDGLNAKSKKFSECLDSAKMEMQLRKTK